MILPKKCLLHFFSVVVRSKVRKNPLLPLTLFTNKTHSAARPTSAVLRTGSELNSPSTHPHPSISFPLPLPPTPVNKGYMQNNTCAAMFLFP